jgi:hypothetical protein
MRISLSIRQKGLSDDRVFINSIGITFQIEYFCFDNPWGLVKMLFIVSSSTVKHFPSQSLHSGLEFLDKGINLKLFLFLRNHEATKCTFSDSNALLVSITFDFCESDLVSF